MKPHMATDRIADRRAARAIAGARGGIGRGLVSATTAVMLLVWLTSGGPARAQSLIITPLSSGDVIRAMDAPGGSGAVAAGAGVPVPVIAGDEATAPRRAGLPRASVIIGDMAVLAGYDPRGPLGLDLATRQAIYQRDSALFQRLLGRGAFDPDAERVAEAIQTELQRMACYDGGIDGAWGPGSARAVARWSEVSGLTVPAQPDLTLFRGVAGQLDLRCPDNQPAVAAQAPANSAPRATATRRAAPAQTTPSRAAQPRTQPRAQPAQTQPRASAPSRQINPSLMGSGLFR